MGHAIAAVDLFCGAGGLTNGLRRAGVKVVAGVDVDETCRFPLEANHPGTAFVQRDIASLTSTEVAKWFPAGTTRLLAGCAPCQPFSKYTMRYGNDDTRWQLLLEFLRLVRGVRPEFVSMENVPELARRSHPAFLEFVEGLERSGYTVWHKVVDCADFGVPQTRQRLVLLASREYADLSILGSARHRTVRSVIGELPHIQAGGGGTRDHLHVACGLSERNMRRIRATPEGGGWADWPEKLRLACHKRKTGRYYGSVYGRMSWDELAPTITTQCYGYGNGRFGHPEQHRAISLREAAMLQTFPRRYKFVPRDQAPTFLNVGRHIGNAVPPRLALAIGRKIKRLIKP